MAGCSVTVSPDKSICSPRPDELWYGYGDHTPDIGTRPVSILQVIGDKDELWALLMRKRDVFGR